jgi:hypothetical protein
MKDINTKKQTFPKIKYRISRQKARLNNVRKANKNS